MKKYLTLLYLIFICLSTQAQQDPQYTMYFFNMAGINPAYAGSRDCGVLTMIGRKQWAGLNGSPETGNLSFHSRIGKSLHGGGVNLIADHIGPYSQISLSGMFAYRLMLNNNWRLALGLNLGGANLKGDLNSLTREIAGDPLLAGNQFSLFIPNAGAGVYLDSRKFFAGFSIPRLIESRWYPKTLVQSKAVWARHMNFSGGAILDIHDDVKFRPSFLVKYVEGIWTLDLNASFLISEKFWAGVSYRRGDAITLIFEWYATQKLRVGYAYDIPISLLNRSNTGSHEIMIRYEFNKQDKGLISPRYF